MALSVEQKQLVQNSFIRVAVISDQVAELFYSRLFELAPSVQPLFKGDMHEQGRKLMQMLATVISGLNELETLVPHIEALGKRHVAYGVKEEHYGMVGEVLLWTLEQGLGDDFTPDVKAAWAEVYTVLAHTALSGVTKN